MFPGYLVIGSREGQKGSGIITENRECDGIRVSELQGVCVKEQVSPCDFENLELPVIEIGIN
jgi:hypothetical protein